MIAINPKVLYHFEFRVFEELFAKHGVQRALLGRCNQRFLLTLKGKISMKGHFIDDSNKYKFIYYVLSSSFSEKKHFRQALSFYFTPTKV